jgi:putative tryptophan/tyrosine transport system substrate-binding protein
MTRRREFITLIAGAAASWSFTACAQQRNVPLIGFLSVGSGGGRASFFIDGFRKGLAEAGYFEGKNVTIEYRWAANYKELPALAKELVDRPVTLLVASPLSGGMAAKAATTTIPIVFASGGDPVEAGLVDSLNHPGGNVTGIAEMTQEIVPKRLQILRDLMPGASVFAMLVNPDARSTPAASAAAVTATQNLGVQLYILSTKSPDDLSDAFAKITELHANGYAITPDPLFFNEREHILSLAARYKLPGIYFDRIWAASGGLMSYGSSLPGTFHQIGLYAGRVLKGENPGDLPIQQPTKFEFVINLKTAQVLGLNVPQTLLTTADEVIE